MISIIVPVYNREKFIQLSIDSVKAQTYTDWELIIVDDGSSDSTISICEKAVADDPRIKLFTCHHHGVSVARNTGLQKAAGEYIFFMDSDDLIHPRLLEELLRVISDDKKVTAASVKLKQFQNDDLSDPEFFNFDLTERIENHHNTVGEDFITSLILTMYQTGAIGGKMFSADSLKGLTFDKNISNGEDTFFIYQYALKGGCMANCDVEWYFYRRHESGASHIAKKNIDPEVCIQASNLMYKNEKARGNQENARLLKTHIFNHMQRIFINAREQKIHDKEREIRRKFFGMLLKDRDHAASPKIWLSFLILTFSYPLHKKLKKLFRHR